MHMKRYGKNSLVEPQAAEVAENAHDLYFQLPGSTSAVMLDDQNKRTLNRQANSNQILPPELINSYSDRPLEAKQTLQQRRTDPLKLGAVSTVELLSSVQVSGADHKQSQSLLDVFTEFSGGHAPDERQSKEILPVPAQAAAPKTATNVLQTP